MRPLGLYVHWPFCAKICPYCDFTIAKHREVDVRAWTQVLLEDLKVLAERAEPRKLVSVYFGGGTPSLMPLNIASALLFEAEKLFGFIPDIELTFEANPDDRARFQSFSDVGFNRLSLGVQSFDGKALKFLGRNHDGREAHLSLDEAVQHFGRVSVDLIYARPGQSLADWSSDLSRVVASGVGHVSLYQLTIEPRTAFGRARERGSLNPMPDDDAADLYAATQDLMEAEGLPAYEVSNHARAGEEAVHNSLYWNDADWLAIGPGAHGRLGPMEERLATVGAPSVKAYPSLPLTERLSMEPLTVVEARTELLAGGLRQVRGMEIGHLGADREAVLEAARPFIRDGWLREDEGVLAASPRGRLVLDYLTAELASALSSEGDV